MKVGVWVSDHKWKKLNFCRLEELLAARGHQVVRLDLDQPLEPQGPFAAILHKVSGEMAKADEGDIAKKKRIDSFQKYLDDHPEVIVFDPIQGVRILMDRKNLCVVVAESDLVRQGILYAPPFVELTSTDATQNLKLLKATGLRFPLVCKPLMAHGTSETHLMSLTFNESGVKDVKCPCVAQSFIQHNARLFKLYVMKDKYYVVERPSLKNFVAGDDLLTIHFDTHAVSKADSSSPLSELDEEQENGPQEVLSNQKCDEIVKEFRKQLGLTLFGIDVIVERGSGRHAVIDINFFPDYNGVPTFLSEFADLISEEIRIKVKADVTTLLPCKASKAKPHGEGTNDVDSGIDTSDSCDEKKAKNDRKIRTMRTIC